MKTLKVTLKQHTPLIHFQHDQYGATLRASEVKPKLDRFIIAHAFNNEYERCKHYLVGYKFSQKDSEEARREDEEKLNRNLKQKFKDSNYKSLNYKIAVHTNGSSLSVKMESAKDRRTNKTLNKLEAFPLVLSNMGKTIEESVNFVQYDIVDIIITVRCEQLYNTLKDNIEHFFALTNFGQRQDKGFGSFTVLYIEESGKAKVEKKWTDELANELMPHNTQYFSYKTVQKEKKLINKELFEVIDYYWKLLKSGINYTKRIIKENNGKRITIERKKKEAYKKAFLWEYLERNGVTWEKRKIKEGLLENKNGRWSNVLISAKAEGDPDQKANHLPCFFARAHLGCPINGIKYKVMTGKPKTNENGEFERNKKGYLIESDPECYDITVNPIVNEKKSDEMNRIPSPIIFKPIFCEDNTVKVYILLDTKVINALYDDKNKNRMFKFDIKKENRKFKPVDIPLFCKRNKEDTNVFFINYQDLIEKFHEEYGNSFLPVNYKYEPILGNNDNEVKFNFTTKG